MKHYLYRPVATEAIEPEFEWDYGIEPGFVLGRRASGYLSRSSAVEAGQKSGVAFEVQRSNPITFGVAPCPEAQLDTERRARLGAALADLVLSGDIPAAAVLAREIFKTN